MTAYALYGMILAKEAGHDVLMDVMDRGTRKLSSMLDAKELDATTKAYMLYILSLSTKVITVIDPHVVAAQIRSFSPKDPNNYAIALLALANQNAGNRSEALACIRQLERAKKFQDRLTYWDGKSWHYDWQNDNVETTALALKAILNVRGDGTDVKDGIRWLLTRRKGFSWESTRQTAMTLFTLVDYMHMSKEMNPDYVIRVFVNDQNVWQKKMTRSDVFVTDQRIRIDSKYLRSGLNSIRYEKSGDGTIYFTARVLYYSPEKPITPHSSGFTVRRDYFRLVKQRVGSEIVYTKQQLQGSIKSGDEIFVKVTVNPSEAYEYFMLEDPLPSGCEVIRQTDGYKIINENGYDGNDYYRWRWWWADRDIRDEKVSFFARNIDPGKHEFTYIMRAQIPGRYSVMPSVATLMYYPEVRGNAAEHELLINK